LSVTCDRSVVFSTNKTDHHNITEILLKVALNTIKQTIYGSIPMTITTNLMINFCYNQRFTRGCITHISDSARHWSQDIITPIFQIVLKNFIKISLIVKNVLKKFWQNWQLSWRFQTLAETLSYDLYFYKLAWSLTAYY
jgi:hypothetical protein